MALFRISKPDPVEYERKENFKALIKLLNYKDDPYIRWKSAEIIGKHKIKEAVPFLIKNIDDENWQVRVKSIEALGNIQDTRCIDKLIERLDDENWQVRVAVCRALGKIREKRATKKLLLLIDDKK